MSVIQFCSGTVENWVEVIDEKHSESAFTQDLLYIFAASRIFTESSNTVNSLTTACVRSSSGLLVRAVERGRIEIVEYFASTHHEKGSKATSTAAELGRLDI